MQILHRKLTPAATALWSRRADALVEGSLLVSCKPDRCEWTREEYRLWRYAKAITDRMNKLH